MESHPSETGLSCRRRVYRTTPRVPSCPGARRRRATGRPPQDSLALWSNSSPTCLTCQKLPRSQRTGTFSGKQVPHVSRRFFTRKHRGAGCTKEPTGVKAGHRHWFIPRVRDSKRLSPQLPGPNPPPDTGTDTVRPRPPLPSPASRTWQVSHSPRLWGEGEMGLGTAP